MSEVQHNDQQEQNQTENQQQNVEVAAQNQSQSQQHPAEQRHQEEKRQLTIETNLQGSQSDNAQNISSPKTDGSQKIIKQQSPGLIKGKLDVLRNLYNQKLEQFNSIDKSGFQKEQQLQDLRAALSDAQKNEAVKVDHAAQQVSQKNQIVSDLESRLNNLRSSDVVSVYSQRVTQISSQILNASQKIHERETQGKDQIIQTKVGEKVNQLTQTTQNLRNRKDQILSHVNGNRSKLSDERNHLETLLNKLIDATKGNNSAKLSELESQHKNVEQQIQNRKQALNKLRSELEAIKNSPNTSQTSQTPDLTTLKSVVQEVKKTKAQIQKEIEAQHKQFKDVANKIKSNETIINKNKTKNSEINQKTKKLEEQKNKLEKQVGEGKKKTKFEQKIPEQLLALRIKKAALQKEAKLEIERTDKQRNKQDNLVPASVIETMKEKITKVKEQNEKYGKLIVDNNHLREENAKLDATKQGMQWETTSQIKIVVANVQKQQAKHDALEKQIIQIRNRNIQVANKLQEYANQYPDFKPEKKQKKPELVQTQQQGKAQPQVKKEAPVEQKGGRKKKTHNKSSPQVSQVIVPEVVEEIPSPVTPQPEKIQKKEQTKSGKAKNKVKKTKQAEEPIVQKKEEPAKKQEPKIEAPKKEQPLKKEEPKVENKPAQVSQANKNKKKR